MTTPDLPSFLIVQQMATGTQSFPLLAVPFFVLAGHILNASGITYRLLRFANLLTRHLVGGLAHASIALTTMMGGISGSATADAAMQSRILTNDMLQRGYSKGYSVGIISVSSLITAALPPSIGLILYGFIGGVSISKLFLAGIIPGLLMAVILMAASYLVAKKEGYDQTQEFEKPSLLEVLKGLKDCIWAILFPIILIVGIRFGIFSASEGGAVAVVYATLIGFVVYRELNWTKLKSVITDAVSDTSMIMLIISAAGILGYIFSYENLPRFASDFITGITEQPTLLLFIVLLFVFLVGLFIEATAVMLLMTPLFLPVVIEIGYDPVAFGIIMVILVTMGGMTPPVGVTMFAVSSITKTSIAEYTKGSLPFLGAIIVLIVLLVIFPQISLYLPNLLLE